MKNQTDFSMYRRAQDCIAQGSLTNSKRPESFIKGIYPTHVKSGNGCFLVDHNGRKYIDFLCGLGSNLIGYGNQSIASAVNKQLSKGSVFSLASVLEVELAEKIKQIFPFIDVMKFLKTGSEATAAALRIARTKTGRSNILSEGYHSWHDEFTSLTPPSIGIPPHLNISKLEDIKKIDDTIAAVIVEPIIVDHSEDRINWLRALRDKCTETGTILIFDEIITGFRYPKYCVSQYYGITPDIICLGKAMGGGLPLSLVAGKKEVMNCGEYFVSSTFAGDTIAMAASYELINLLQTKFKLDTLFEKANIFQDSFNKLSDLVRLSGYGTRSLLTGDPLAKALFCQESCKAGILFHPTSLFFNFCHIDLADQVLNSCKDILNRIKNGQVKLEGEMPQTPFSQKTRG